MGVNFRSQNLTNVCSVIFTITFLRYCTNQHAASSHIINKVCPYSCRYSYSKEEKNHPVMTLNHHKKACRAIRFSASGERLFTASKDKSLQMIDVNQGAVAQSLKKAHE